MKRFCTVLGAVSVLGATAGGCKASVDAKASTAQGVSRSGRMETGNGGTKDSATQEGFAREDAPAAVPSERSLSGARPDLRLGGEQSAPVCHCLSVAVGQPTDPSFVWVSDVPVIDPARQVVMAFRSEGVACSDGPKESLGASYWGTLREGEDVIVVVENAAVGKPVTQGAIISRPQGNGKILVRPLNPSTPYGGALDSPRQPCALRVQDSP
ncbi:hypothetical protein ACFL5O_07340 [Myxococcota bacterium]